MADKRLVIGVIVASLVVCIGGGIFLVSHVTKLAKSTLGVGGFSGQPLPEGDRAVTEAQLEPLWRGYYRKNLVTAYEQHGKHDARWDKAAKDFLELHAVVSTGLDEDRSFKDLVAPGLALLKRGCDDPLIVMLTGNALRVQNRVKEARPLIERSLPGLKERGYPPLMLAWAYFSMADFEGEVGSKLESADFKWRTPAIDAFVAAADKSGFGPQEQRPLWWEIQNLMESHFRRSQAQIVNTMKARPNTDPWLFRMAWGKHNFDYGWFYRGNDFIQNVKPEDYKEFEKGMGFARGNFEQAYAAHPEYPEASVYLLDIAKTGAVSGMESERTWFDRAVAGQFDWMPAYYDYISALQPRWGGSHEALLAFAKECVDTARFDTLVPKIYYEVVLTIAEHDREDSVWSNPEIWPPLQTYCKGRLTWAVKNKPKYVKQIRTVYALIAWRSGHPDVARQQLEAMQGQIDKPTFDAQWSERAELIVGMIYGLTGPRKEKVRQAEELYAAEKIDQALAAYQALLEIETDKPALYFLRDRIQSLRWEKQFQANQWVNLDPTPDLVGWDIWQGRFKPLADGKGFTMWPGERFGLMSCMMRPGSSFEIRCDVEFPNEKVKGIEAGFLVDIPLTANPYYDSCRVIQNPPESVFGPGWDAFREHALSEVPRKCRLRLIQCENRVTMYLDKQTVLQDQQLSDRGFRFQGPHHVAIGGEVWPDPTKPVIYRNIQIHKLSGDAVKGRLITP
ncbi:MAG: hypothetical protein ABFD96_01660 [Armatimonadia bacterium]